MLQRAGGRASWRVWLEERWRSAHAPSLAAVGLTLGLGCAYFLAARLGLALLNGPGGVAVFWPASGIAAGALIVLGKGARTSVALGVLGATIAANVLIDRSVLTAVAFGACNAGEALLAAWLVQRWCSQPFRLDGVLEGLRGVRSFLAASALAPAVASVGAAIAVHQLHAPAPLLGVWYDWTVSDALGIVAVAPLLIGLHGLASERLPANEMLEGATALALLVLVSAAIYTAPADSWMSQMPPAVLFPLVLWVAARCRPAFAAASAAIISSALVGSATFRIGPFASGATPVLGIQLTMLVASLCALTLAALFAERRRSERALKETNERLELALGGAQLGVWGVDLATGAFESDARDSQINGHDPAVPPRTLTQARKFVHPEDLVVLDSAFAAARRTGAHCQAEYRVRAGGVPDAGPASSPGSGSGAGPMSGPEPGLEPGPELGRVRWVAVEGNVVRDAAGRAVRLLGVTRDITERKLAEVQKDLLLAELDHRVKNALAVVAAVASRAQETSGSLAEFVAALNGRIKSMATAHDLLSGRKWQGMPLAELIARELEPYATRGNVRIEGPDVVLRAEAGQALAMAVHELVTNAAKYGALSVERGRVSVLWARAGGSGAGGRLMLDWVETGGPALGASTQPGYGTSVIRDLVPYELGGSADIKLAPDGLRCRLSIPDKWLSGGSDRPHEPNDRLDASPKPATASS